jgi:hypothetical protein
MDCGNSMVQRATTRAHHGWNQATLPAIEPTPAILEQYLSTGRSGQKKSGLAVIQPDKRAAVRTASQSTSIATHRYVQTPPYGSPHYCDLLIGTDPVVAPFVFNDFSTCLPTKGHRVRKLCRPVKADAVVVDITVL